MLQELKELVSRELCPRTALELATDRPMGPRVYLVLGLTGIRRPGPGSCFLGCSHGPEVAGRRWSLDRSPSPLA